MDLIRLSGILIFSFLISCSPQKKLNRLVKKHPELMTKDTLLIKIQDTIVVTEIKHDTISQLFYNDTIKIIDRTIDNSRVVLKYFYDTLTRNIYHDLKVETDTIFIEKQVPVIVDRIEIKELSWWQKNNFWVIGLLVAFLLAIIYKKV
jgi:hypothetical protein